MKRILIWNTYGCSSTRTVCKMFRDYQEGATYEDECAGQVPRAAWVIRDFLKGDEQTLLVMCRDAVVIDLITLLAFRKARVLDLPKVPAAFNAAGKAMSIGETYDALMESIDKATPHKIQEPPE